MALTSTLACLLNCCAGVIILVYRLMPFGALMSILTTLILWRVSSRIFFYYYFSVVDVTHNDNIVIVHAGFYLPGDLPEGGCIALTNSSKCKGNSYPLPSPSSSSLSHSTQYWKIIISAKPILTLLLILIPTTIITACQ